MTTHMYTHGIPCWPNYYLKSNNLLFRASNLVFYILNMHADSQSPHLHLQIIYLPNLELAINYSTCMNKNCAWNICYDLFHILTVNCYTFQHVVSDPPSFLTDMYTHTHMYTTHTNTHRHYTHAHHIASSPGHTRLFKMFSILHATLKRQEWLGDE